MTELFTIKPLEWEFRDEGALRKYEASCPFSGVYRVLEWRLDFVGHGQWSGEWFYVYPQWTRLGSARCASPEEGKRLAESHWQAYIRQALELVRSDGEATELREFGSRVSDNRSVSGR